MPISGNASTSRGLLGEQLFERDTSSLNPQSWPSHPQQMSSMLWTELHTISSCGSGEGPLLLHLALPAAPLPQELPQVREEGVPFPGSRPQDARLPGHCSEEEAPMAHRTLVTTPDVGSHAQRC